MIKTYIKGDKIRHFNIQGDKVVGAFQLADDCWVSNPTLSSLVEDGWSEYTAPEVNPEPEVLPYEEQVVAYIRERYTVDDELALLRQRDTKPEEFAEYNAFCEECKAKAKGQA